MTNVETSPKMAGRPPGAHPRPYATSRLALIAAAGCALWLLSNPAFAEDETPAVQVQPAAGAAVSTTNPKCPQETKAAGTCSSGIPAAQPSTAAAAPTMSPGDQAIAAALAKSPARLDKLVGMRGWDIPFPSYGDLLLGDIGGWRSDLADYGIGFSVHSVNIFSKNILDGVSSNISSAEQRYWGQKTSIFSGTEAFLTYDLQRYGVPDGQFQFAWQYNASTMDPYVQSRTAMIYLAWYQTLFNKALELHIGYIPNAFEFTGTFIGSNFANPFGPSAGIPTEMGLSQAPTTQPTARVTWHVTKDFYNELGVMRSLPINGLTGNTMYDDIGPNRLGFNFNVPNGGTLVTNEIGYKTKAEPGHPMSWFRIAGMYNNSDFPDYRAALNQLNTGTYRGVMPTDKGTGAFYALYDQQVWQSAPNSVFSAYRGLYLGASAMYMPPENAPYSQYYEARAYVVGPFDSRPRDMVQLVYTHNTFSSSLTDFTNTAYALSGGLSGVKARSSSNTISTSYLAHIIPGVIGSVGLNYTDHPTLVYNNTSKESSLALQASLYFGF